MNTTTRGFFEGILGAEGSSSSLIHLVFAETLARKEKPPTSLKPARFTSLSTVHHESVICLPEFQFLGPSDVLHGDSA